MPNFLESSGKMLIDNILTISICNNSNDAENILFIIRVLICKYYEFMH